MKTDYRSTLHSCYIGMITQAVANNLVPLLFVIFQRQFGISLEMIGRLVLINFMVQMCVDILALRYAVKIGYRVLAVASHALCGAGLIGLSAFPALLPSPYVSLVCAVVLYAIGSGMIEVLISPMVDSIDMPNKSLAMCLTHSFYCWGQLAVMLLSTLALYAAGEDMWFILPWVWSAVPFYNMIRFMRVPIVQPAGDKAPMGIRDLLSKKNFLLFLAIMMCAGASELSMSQWASFFAQKGLGVPKAVGDMLGPCMFAALMGLGRLGYGFMGTKIKLRPALICGAALCTACYMTVALTDNPVLSLAACALCGLSVSIMWPGTVSMSSDSFPLGGTAMFAALAMFGDIGCSLGPWLTGVIADVVNSGAYVLKTQLLSAVTLEQSGLRGGILCAALFPALLILCVVFLKRRKDIL